MRSNSIIEALPQIWCRSAATPSPQNKGAPTEADALLQLPHPPTLKFRHDGLSHANGKAEVEQRIRYQTRARSQRSFISLPF